MSGIMSELQQIRTAEDVTVIGNAAIESEIVLTAIRNECTSDEEFSEVLESAGTELALYDVISDADIATEAAKRIVVKDWKAANFNRIAKRTAIRMAMINNDALYAKYKKYRDLLIATREKLYVKYGNKAKVEAKKIIKNARNKAANMNSKAGKDITSKIDAQIAKAEANEK
jgi:hypothetical protein